MLTIFAVPKPFRGHIGVIQRNAIRSWLSLSPACDVLLLGDEDGTEAIAKEFSLRYEPDIARNEYGTPLLNSVFERAEGLSRHAHMCYVNADIILMSDILRAVRYVANGPRLSSHLGETIELSLPDETLKLRRNLPVVCEVDTREHVSGPGNPSFLMAGQRWDVDLRQPLNFELPDWEDRLRAVVINAGKLYRPAGTDYLVFPRHLWNTIPPFALGRWAWDQWLIYSARKHGIPVVDASKIVMAVHQDHGHDHLSDGSTETWRKGAEAKRNLELVGGRDHIFTLLHATHVLTDRQKGLVPALFRTLRDRDLLIHQLEDEFDERTEWALRLDREVKEKDERILKLQKEFDERTEWALRLDREVKEKDGRVLRLQKELKDKDEQLLKLRTHFDESREKENERIAVSRIYRRIVDRLFRNRL